MLIASTAQPLTVTRAELWRLPFTCKLKFNSASTTGSELNAQSRAIFSNDKFFVVSNSVLTIHNVASYARGYEIFWRIIVTVVVKMLGYKRSRSSVVTGHPIYQYPTAMTGVRSRAETLPQNFSMLRDIRRFGYQRMVRRVNHAVFGRDVRFTPISVCACFCAVLSELGKWSGIGSSAVGAFSCGHALTIPHSRVY